MELSFQVQVVQELAIGFVDLQCLNLNFGSRSFIPLDYGNMGLMEPIIRLEELHSNIFAIHPKTKNVKI